MTSFELINSSRETPGMVRRLIGLLQFALYDTVGRWLFGIGTVLVVVLFVLPALLPASPTDLGVGTPLSPPSGEHLMGTDQLGRDIATRVVYGARISIGVAVASAACALAVGGFLGALAGSGARWVDALVMRLTDVAMAFPGILLAIVLAAVLGPSLPTTVIVLAVVYAPWMARVVRAAILKEYGEDYVTAARLLGTRRFRLVGYHVGVNAAFPVLVYTTVIMAEAIIAEAALSFLGAGIKAPAPSWGNIIREGQEVVQAGAWWVSLFPGAAMVLCVLALNRLSEALGRRLRRD